MWRAHTARVVLTEVLQHGGGTCSSWGLRLCMRCVCVCVEFGTLGCVGLSFVRQIWACMNQIHSYLSQSCLMWAVGEALLVRTMDLVSALNICWVLVIVQCYDNLYTHTHRSTSLLFISVLSFMITNSHLLLFISLISLRKPEWLLGWYRDFWKEDENQM